MKKLFTLLLSVLMVFSLVACSNGSSEGGEEEKVVAYLLAEKGNTYDLGLCSNFQGAWEEMGLEVIMDTFPSDTTNFSDYIQKAIDKKASLIFAPTSTPYAANILSCADDLGFDKPILACDTWESSVILDAVKGTELEVYVSSFFDEGVDSGVAKEFVDGFKAFLNSDSTYLAENGGNDIVAAVSALGFDAYNVAIEAIKLAAETKGKEMTSLDVACALCELTYEDAVTGKIEFDEIGDAIKDTAYIKQANNEGAFVYKTTTTVKNDAQKGSVKDYSGYNSVALDTVNKKIVIGVFEPLTGSNGAGGKQEVLGMKYANSLNNSVVIDGEEYKVELLPEDNQSSADYAGSAASAIVASKALVVLGSYGSSVAIAGAPVFEAAGIPAIGVSCTNAAVTDGNDLYFRVCYLDPFQGPVMANFAYQLVK